MNTPYISEFETLATKNGLDYFEMEYVSCPAHVIQTIGTIFHPVRMEHWLYGKRWFDFKEQMKDGKIYELVINTEPCYAFFLEDNEEFENKLIVAHVLAHSDFFKNNRLFQNSGAISSMSQFHQHKIRIEEIESTVGVEKVEKTLEALYAIEEYPHIMDVILQHSTNLEPWQKEIITIMKTESSYFQPQTLTKIMNEGWATFWHIRLMRQANLTLQETANYAKLHQKIISPYAGSVNPYLLGYEIFKYIEKEYGSDHLWKVRQLDSDYSFVRDYFTPEVQKQIQLFSYKERSDKKAGIVTDIDFHMLKSKLLSELLNGGIPKIEVEINANTLELRHVVIEKMIDKFHLRLVLQKLKEVWQGEIIFILESKKETSVFTLKERFDNGELYYVLHEDKKAV